MKILKVSAIFLAMASLLGLFACTENEGPTREMRFRQEGSPEELGPVYGDSLELSPADRQALLVIVNGIVPSEGRAAIEVDRVIDAGITVSRRPVEGDPHWITRGKVVDEQGKVLWSQRVNSLFQLLQFLELVVQQQDGVQLTALQIYRLVAHDYPELLQFALKVPTGIEGGVSYILEIQNESGKWSKVATLDLAELIAQARPPEVEGEVSTLVDNGPDDDRITIAILGDGYTAAERVKFEGDAQAVAQEILNTSPMAEHADLFNIKVIWTPSQESGAGYDCQKSDPNCDYGFRDTFYETVFVLPAIIDRYSLPLHAVESRGIAMPMQIGKVFEAASLANYDEIVLISNSLEHSGFAGLYIALVTAFDRRNHFPKVAVHELGHTLGLLGDEYMGRHDPCFFNEPLIPLPANIGQITDGTVKWSDWLDDGTPLPTPASEAARFAVGAFQGAYNCDFLVRPSATCMMRTSGHDFCPICAEQMVRRFYSFVDPAPAENVLVARTAPWEVRIRLPLRGNGERYEVLWTANGTPLTHTGPVLQLNASALGKVPSGKWVKLEAVVRNKTGFIRTPDEQTESHYVFEIRLEDLP